MALSAEACHEVCFLGVRRFFARDAGDRAGDLAMTSFI